MIPIPTTDTGRCLSSNTKHSTLLGEAFALVLTGPVRFGSNFTLPLHGQAVGVRSVSLLSFGVLLKSDRMWGQRVAPKCSSPTRKRFRGWSAGRSSGSCDLSNAFDKRSGAFFTPHLRVSSFSAPRDADPPCRAQETEDAATRGVRCFRSHGCIPFSR